MNIITFLLQWDFCVTRLHCNWIRQTDSVFSLRYQEVVLPVWIFLKTGDTCEEGALLKVVIAKGNPHTESRAKK